MGLLGKPTILGNLQLVEYDALKALELLSFDHILNVVVVQILENWNFPFTILKCERSPLPFQRRVQLFENYLRLKCYFATFTGKHLIWLPIPPLGNLSPPQNADIPQICLLLIAARLNAETLEPFRHAFIGVDTETWKKF